MYIYQRHFASTQKDIAENFETAFAVNEEYDKFHEKEIQGLRENMKTKISRLTEEYNKIPSKSAPPASPASPVPPTQESLSSSVKRKPFEQDSKSSVKRTAAPISSSSSSSSHFAPPS